MPSAFSGQHQIEPSNPATRFALGYLGGFGNTQRILTRTRPKHLRPFLAHLFIVISVDELLLLVTESPVLALNDEDTSFAVWMFERSQNAFHEKLGGV
jgi:hypothetical protein